MALRVDKWLWHTRFFRTRAQATQAVKGGHVVVNGERARPSRTVTAGDVIEIVRDRVRFTVSVLSEPPRRGPARDAAGWYREHPESIAAREAQRAALRADRAAMPATAGRPDKHTRRKLRDIGRRDS
ncbi:MAG: RNA-binding S4 domain-containing protein [Pseudomonadota bacterium]